MIAGSDTLKGSASALTERSGLRGKPLHQSPPRRVGKRGESAIQRLRT